MNLWMCADSSTNTKTVKIQKQIYIYPYKRTTMLIEGEKTIGRGGLGGEIKRKRKVSHSSNLIPLKSSLYHLFQEEMVTRPEVADHALKKKYVYNIWIQDEMVARLEEAGYNIKLQLL